jgi:SlyX protein
MVRMENENEIFDKRLTAIETKLTYMEDFIKQLQEVTVAHTNEIARLRDENRLMAAKIRDMSDQLEGDIPNRKPPHY